MQRARPTNDSADCRDENTRRSAWQTFLAGIPQRKIERLGRVLGWLIYHVDARHRRIVRRNLRFAFPQWQWERVLKTSRHVFQNFGVTALEIIQSSCFTLEELTAKVVTVQGSENRKYLSNPNGVVIVSAHLGNWEIAVQYISSFTDTPFAAVARKIRFKPLERWVFRLRTRFGGELIDKKGAAADMRRALRQGKILAVLNDQSGEGAFVRFFGRKVQAHAGVALLAQRCKSPVVPAFCVRDKDGFRIIIDSPLVLQQTGDLRADIQANTQIIMDAIEKTIHRYPEQWFWFHKRWKAFYPHLYQEDLKRQWRKEEKKFGKSV